MLQCNIVVWMSVITVDDILVYFCAKSVSISHMTHANMCASNVLQMYRKLQNFQAEQPYSHAWYYMTVLLVDHCWTKEDLMRALEGMPCYISIVAFSN